MNALRRRRSRKLGSTWGSYFYISFSLSLSLFTGCSLERNLQACIWNLFRSVVALWHLWEKRIGTGFSYLFLWYKIFLLFNSLLIIIESIIRYFDNYLRNNSKKNGFFWQGKHHLFQILYIIVILSLIQYMNLFSK